MNYGRIEAANPQLDLLDLSARRLATLVVEWLMNVMDPDAWNDHYKDLFFGDPGELERRREARERIKPRDETGRGSMNLKRAERADANEELQISIGGKPVRPVGASGPHITAGDDGEMTVE